MGIAELAAVALVAEAAAAAIPARVFPNLPRDRTGDGAAAPGRAGRVEAEEES